MPSCLLKLSVLPCSDLEAPRGENDRPDSCRGLSTFYSPSHQSHVPKHRDTYDQAQGCIEGHQGSIVNRRYHLSLVDKFWHLRSPLPQGNRCFSIFKCANGAVEGKECWSCTASDGKNKPAHLLLHCPAKQHPWVQLRQQQQE